MNNLHIRYIVGKYKHLMNDIFTNGLEDRDLNLTDLNY